MTFQRRLLVAKTLTLIFLIGLISMFTIKGMFGAAGAQSGEERELEDTTPKHIPIKIKVKNEKEKAFKDLSNDHWLRDLEIEVKNTGDKPIFYIGLVVSIPGIRAPNGNEVGFPLHYGNVWDIKVPPKPEDVSLKPGESYVFKIPDSWVKGWERDKSRPQPKKIRLIFQKLNFGDGTGFSDSGGTAVSAARRERANNVDCLPELNKNGPDDRFESWRMVANDSVASHLVDLPARFLPAKFFPADGLTATKVNASPISAAQILLVLSSRKP